MNYRTLLVHLDDSTHSDARVEFALDLAQKHDAHLIGLYVVCQDLFRPLFSEGDSLRLAIIEAQGKQREENAHARFLSAGERAGRAVEWRAPAGPASEVATLHARHADLLIVGQQDPDDPASYIAHDARNDDRAGADVTLAPPQARRQREVLRGTNPRAISGARLPGASFSRF
jgi:nucleotide-binding universal stress UspA family protein